MNEMFCFQCEQTAGGNACTGKAGVCGKPASNANLQDELTGALVKIWRNRRLCCHIDMGWHYDVRK